MSTLGDTFPLKASGGMYAFVPAATSTQNEASEFSPSVSIARPKSASLPSRSVVSKMLALTKKYQYLIQGKQSETKPLHIPMDKTRIVSGV